jgi:hypothetical protein
MGHTYTVLSPYVLHLGHKQLSVSWELNLALVKASKHEYYLFYILEICLILYRSLYLDPWGLVVTPDQLVLMDLSSIPTLIESV